MSRVFEDVDISLQDIDDLYNAISTDGENIYKDDVERFIKNKDTILQDYQGLSKFMR